MKNMCENREYLYELCQNEIKLINEKLKERHQISPDAWDDLNNILDDIEDLGELEIDLCLEDEKMKIKINTHGNPLPVAKGEWVDLYTAEDARLKQFEYKTISLGVSMELPKGYYARIVPRSSTFKNFGVLMTNSMGIIENSYCGDNDIWGFPALAMRDTFIPKGTRICQFQLEKQSEPIEFEQLDNLGNVDRGGFGSTGTK